MPTNEELIRELAAREAKIKEMGGAGAVKKQHDLAKLTARERLDQLLDPASFVETGMHVKHRSTYFGLDKIDIPADGVVTGFGKINGRTVCCCGDDFTSRGGSLGEMHAWKVARTMDLAAKMRVPIISMLDTGGARIQEGINALDGYGQIFHRNTLYSGVIPQITMAMGPCAGGAVYSPALTDWILMVAGTSYMFVTGPDVVKAVMSEEVTQEQLGGAMMHARKSGIAHFVYNNDAADRLRLVDGGDPAHLQALREQVKGPLQIALTLAQIGTEPEIAGNLVAQVIILQMKFLINSITPRITGAKGCELPAQRRQRTRCHCD